MTPGTNTQHHGNRMAPLQFIDNSSPFASGDRAARRAIRSKAAAGKNAGRRVNRPSRAAALRGQLSQRRALWVTAETNAQIGEDSRALQIPENVRSHCSLSLGLLTGAVGAPMLGATLPVHGLPFEAWALSTGSMETIQRGKSFSREEPAKSCFELMPPVLLFVPRPRVLPQHQVHTGTARWHIQRSQPSADVVATCIFG